MPKKIGLSVAKVKEVEDKAPDEAEGKGEVLVAAGVIENKKKEMTKERKGKEK